MSEVRYDEDIRIDESALDVEWLEQPRLMNRYCQLAADAKKAMDLAKEAVDVVRAELQRSIRSNPDEYGIPKLTEAAVESTIVLDEKFRKAQMEYLEARYENEMVTAAVRAIDQRKTALENLVKLYASNYFAGPTAPRDLPSELAKRRKQTDSNSKIKITARKRS